MICEAKSPHILLDVREAIQFDICHLDHAVLIPLSVIEKEPHRAVDVIRGALLLQHISEETTPCKSNKHVRVIFISLSLLCHSDHLSLSLHYSF